MKTFPTLAFAASLVLNGAFAFLIVSHRAGPSPAIVTARPAPLNSARPDIQPGIWPGLGGEDLTALVANLRAAGFPTEILRAIVQAQLSESFAARRKALSPSTDTLPYWKMPSRDPKLELARRELDREEEKARRNLLGTDADSDDPLARLTQNRNLGFLSAEKAVDVRAILRQTDDRRSDLYVAGISETTDRDKIVALEKEQHDRIAQLLTPAELLEYDLRTSRTADQLRNQLDVFKPSEAEFRAIYQLQAAFDERFDSRGLVAFTTPGREDAQKLLTDQIKATLTPERAAEYDRDNDYNYRRTSQIVARLELPPETTNDLWSIQNEFEQKRNKLQSSSREERVQKLTALQQEATARITPLLGDARGVEAYQQYGGQWIQNLVPRTTPAIAPKN